MTNNESDIKQLLPHKIALLVTASLVTLMAIYLIYNQNIVFGSKAGRWVYPYFDESAAVPIWVLLAVLFLIWLLVFPGGKLIQRREAITLTIGFTAALLLQLIIASMNPIPFSSLVKSEIANGFYSASFDYSPGEILSQYEMISPTSYAHAKTNMPGKILFYHFIRLVTENPRVLAYLVISISSLGGLLLYGICSLLFTDKTTAWYAFILYALVPAKLDFFPILNTVTPVFILACLLLLILFIRSGKVLWLIILGLGLYILVLFEPTPLTSGLIFVGILIHALATRQIQTKNLWQITLYTAVSFAVVYLLFLLVFSFDLFAAFQYVLNDVVAYNVRSERGYWVWLAENLKEFIFATGVPVSIIFIYVLVFSISNRLSAIKANFLTRPEYTYLYSLAATFAFVWLMNVNRGETTRLWIYLSVFFQVPAAVVMGQKIKSSRLFFWLAVLLAVQSLVTVTRVRFMNP